MPSNVRKSAKASAKPSGRRSGGAARRGWLTPKRLLIAAGVGVLLIAVPVVRRCVPDLSDRPEYRITVDDISITPIPAWVPPDIVEDALQRAGISGSASVLDETLSERIAAAFHTHPWIERVRSVRKSFPARVHIDVTWRTPVALVQGVDGYYPVNRNAVLLPADAFSQSAIGSYPIIVHVASVPLGSIGEEWGDPAVRGAAELAAVLIGNASDQTTWWDALELRSIAVPSRVSLGDDADDLEFVLITRGGSQIRWGRAPATEHPGELSVAQKLDRLTEYRSGYGGFDDNHGPWEIDIRPWHGIGRSRLKVAGHGSNSSAAGLR